MVGPNPNSSTGDSSPLFVGIEQMNLFQTLRSPSSVRDGSFWCGLRKMPSCATKPDPFRCSGTLVARNTAGRKLGRPGGTTAPSTAAPTGAYSKFQSAIGGVGDTSSRLVDTNTGFSCGQGHTDQRQLEFPADDN